MIPNSSIIGISTDGTPAFVLLLCGFEISFIGRKLYDTFVIQWA